MDTKQLTESENISVKTVTDSPTKKLVILSGGAMVLDMEGKQRFQLLVEMDGTRKMWKPNKTTLKNLQTKHGLESQAWVGKTLNLSIGMVKDKTAIIGTPE